MPPGRLPTSPPEPPEWVSAPRGNNPRDLVVVVETRPAQTLAGQFERAVVEEQAQNRDLAATYHGAALGGFGSGFLLVRQAGSERRAYVVTNHHVVESAARLT